MDYTQSDSYTTHGGTGQRMHDADKPISTIWSDKDANSVLWSLMEIVKAAGLTGIQFDPANPATYQRLRNALTLLIANEVTARLVAGALPAGINIVASFVSPPTGFRLLKRNGQAVPRATYAALDTAIYCGDANNAAAAWGYRCNDPLNPNTTRAIAGTHIVLPRANGRFGRAFSDGDALDSGRSLWTYQADELRAHAHVYSRAALGTSDSVDGGGMTAGVSDDWTANTGGAETRPANYAETAWITY